jgi:hypothetical protein
MLDRRAVAGLPMVLMSALDRESPAFAGIWRWAITVGQASRAAAEQVGGCAVGAGSSHGPAVDGRTDQGVTGFVDRVGGVPGEPGAHGVVQGFAV